MHIDSYGYTNNGKYEINEDCLLCRGNVYVLADGLGGYDEGETASVCAVNYVADNYGGCSDEEIDALIKGANSAVYGLGNGACTTVAVLFVDGNRIRFTNVGDSRVYYFRKGKLLTQTKDHSVCQVAVETGTMSQDEIRGSEDRSKLLKVLGRDDEIKPGRQYEPIEIRNGDAFLICSDGFWEYVYETEMEIDFLKSAGAKQWAEYMLRRHIRRSHCDCDNFSLICGIIHAEEAVEAEEISSTVQITQSPKRKSYIGIILAVGVVLIAAALAFAFMSGNFGKTGTDKETTGQTESAGSDTTEAPTTTEETPTVDGETTKEEPTTEDGVTEEVMTSEEITEAAPTFSEEVTEAAPPSGEEVTDDMATGAEEVTEGSENFGVPSLLT